MGTQWQRIGEGPLTRANWQHWLSEAVRLDPYLVWADLSGMAGFDPQQAQLGRWPVLIELASEDTPLPLAASNGSCSPEAAQDCHPALGLIEVPSAYKAPRPTGQLPKATSRFITATVAPSCVNELLCHSELFKRVQLGVPRIARGEDKDREKPFIQVIPAKTVLVGVIDDGFAFAHQQFRGAPGTGADARGLRVYYLWDQNDRAVDQRPPMDDPNGKPVTIWGETPNFGYGKEATGKALGRAIQEAEQRPDRSPYAWLDYLPRRTDADSQDLRRLDRRHCATRPAASTAGCALLAPADSLLTASHGTAVMALAAGNQPPLGRWHPVQGQVPAEPLESDAASRTALALVQLPTRTTLDASGGSLGVHVLDGLNYLLALSRPTSGDPNPLVVNISYGAIAGPHDGTSILEQAITDIVAQHKHVWVTVAAGNAHGANTHARLELAEGDTACKRLTWRIGPDNLLESYLEIWLPDCDTDGGDLLDSHRAQVKLHLQPPAGLPAQEVCADHGWTLRDGPDAPPIAAAIFSRHVVQGLRGTMVLLTVARTRRPLPGSPDSTRVATAPHGDWVLELQWPGPATKTGRRMAVHAWAERNDQLWGHTRKQQSTVWGDDPVPAKTEFSPTVLEFCAHGDLPYHLDEVPKPFQPELSHGSVGDVDPAAGALSSHLTATLPRGAAVAVGGYRLADQEMAAYSGGGPTRSARADRGRLTGGTCTAHTLPPETAVDGRYPTRQHGPAVDAPSDVGTALRGIRTIGLRDGSVARLGGTSAAAPLLARHIAATLQAKLNGDLSASTAGSSLALVAAPTQTDVAPPKPENARRATLTPTQDDRFRRGQERLVPGAAGPTAPAKTGP